jgi:acetylornithine deacetylase
MTTSTSPLVASAVLLLKQLIATPSLSRNEGNTASLIEEFLRDHQVTPRRQGNNIWAWNKYIRTGRPVILLNSHHDTVKPSEGWQRKPFNPGVEGDRLYGLGSNDAGGSLVSLIATFLHFYERKDLPFNLVIAATAEEEISGAEGIASVLPELGKIHLGIVGEPTQMQMAVAEKGLMVLDCVAHGRSGHAAREEGENAIYKAMESMEWFRTFRFPRHSALMGDMKMTVTQIEAGSQHNVVPDRCSFVVDVRTIEQYTNEEVFEVIRKSVDCEVHARSFRLNSSQISLDHPIVQRGMHLGLSYYGSPTLSDQALMAFTTLKIGPGDSARSHTPDEYICLPEIAQGIDTYIRLLEGLEIDAAG